MNRFLMILLLFFLAACTTRRPLDTEPQGATAYLDGVRLGPTPVVLELRGSSATLKIEKDGYVTELKSIQTITEYDLFSGAITERWPDTFFFRLVPKKAP